MSSLIHPISETNNELLRDESRNIGFAESVSFPENEADIIEILEYCRQKRLPVTVQGALTGLAAGAVPYGGHIINTRKMNKVLAINQEKENSFTLTCQPGVVLSEFRKAIEFKHFNNPNFSSKSLEALTDLRKKGNYFFAPDPTETSACLGGMVSCNASGARTYYYGAMRNHVSRVRMVLTDGRILDLKRGHIKAQGLTLTLPLEPEGVLNLELPKFNMPNTKNAAGYYVEADMDPLDLLIGSDGTLGVITEIDCIILPTPEHTWGISSFWPDEEKALAFVLRCRQEIKNLTSLESFSGSALDLLRQQREKGGIFSQLPYLPPHFGYCIYLELQGNDEEFLILQLERINSLIKELGGESKDTWVALNDTELTRLLFFRHAVPECVNMLIDERKREYPDIAKLGTDMAVPDHKLAEVLQLYRKDLSAANLQWASWGHMGNNHIHVNILPRNSLDYQKGKELYLSWAQKITEMGGAVSAEHGIGKSKKAMLEIMYGQEQIKEMRRLKRIFDPLNMLGRDNLFASEGGVGPCA